MTTTQATKTMASPRVCWTYYVTRDSRDGVLSNICDLWSGVKPKRERQDGAVLWIPKTSNACYLGEHAVKDIQRWFGTIPDTDLELIVIEQWAPEDKPKTRKVVRK